MSAYFGLPGFSLSDSRVYALEGESYFTPALVCLDCFGETIELF